jgi:hypothetical protein
MDDRGSGHRHRLPFLNRTLIGVPIPPLEVEIAA